MGLVSFKKLTLATYRGQKAKGQRVKGEAEEIVGVPQDLEGEVGCWEYSECSECGGFPSDTGGLLGTQLC